MRPPAGTDLEAVPSGSDAGAHEALGGQRVAALLQCAEPLRLTLPRLVEEVSRHKVTPGTPGA